MKEQKICSLTSDSAMAIVAAAVEALKKRGAVASICIVNVHGFEVAKLIMDGARPFTANVALLKAKQAATIGKLTSETRDQLAEGEVTPEILGLQPERTIRWAGGAPIYDQEKNLLGGLGISNLTQEEDENVAKEALFAVALCHKK